MIKPVIEKYKNYIRDFGLSFISSMIVTLTTSFIVNPTLAKMLDIAKYGDVLTICGYITIISSAVGNSLNNIRLLDSKKAEHTRQNNYNLILLIFSTIGTIIMVLLSGFYIKCSSIETFWILVYTFLCTVDLYFIVGFRIELNYVRNLIYSITTSVGFVIGLIFSFWFNCWPLTYVFGKAIGLVYLLRKSNLYKEGLAVDKEFLPIFKKFSVLALTTLLGQVMLMLDRVILHPIVGKEAVSMFNTASFFGKAVSTLFGPIAFVLLSYFAKDSFIMDKKTYRKIGLSGIFIASAALLASIPLTPIVVSFLYPTIYEAAKPYFFIANLGSMIAALAVLLNPIILKICDVKWQMYIQFIHGTLYIVLGVLASSKYGILGFAYATIFSNAIKILIMLVLGEIKCKKT